jgi:hypothetical protein
MAHYVNNAEMLAAIKEYKLALKTAKENETPHPRIPEYLGKCVLMIATKLSHKPNFINYSYRDDMISDGIENCVMCIDSFNPEKSSNPFAYFTQVIYFAFLRRIQKEKKQSYIKGRLIQEMPFDSFEGGSDGDDGEFMQTYINFIQMNSNFDDSFMRKKEKKEPTIKSEQSLENFIDDGEPVDDDSSNN